MLRARRFRGVFCVLIAAGYVWLAFIATSPQLPSEKKPLCFYSNQARDDLKLTLCRALERAKKSITFQIYSLTDPDVLSLLAAKTNEGLDVTLFTDAKATPHLPLTHYPLRVEGLMHRKIFIFDEMTVFLGSANLTPSSLKFHDNLMVGLYHPPLAQFLTHCRSDSFVFDSEGIPAELWLLPDPTGKALDKLLSLIDGAQKKICVALFTFTHPQIASALIEAHKRGIEVTIALDYTTAQGASASIVEKLNAAQVPVLLSQGRQLFHHKWALIDNSLVLGSANWTKNAFTSNQDCLLFLYALPPAQQKFLENLWKTIVQTSLGP